MSYPDLTPASSASAIVLPITGTEGDVADACPIGVYTASVDFLSGAAAQVAYTYKKLGGDILDIEIKAANVYANYEEACLEYSYLVNVHQSKNAIGSALGVATGSFTYTGEFSGSASGSASNKNANTKFPKGGLESAARYADTFSYLAGVGGTEPIYSASFDVVEEQQDYDLQNIVSSSAAAGGVPYANKVGDKRIIIKNVFYRTPYAVWRFYGYYGGLNVVGNMHNYGQYTDDSSFEVIPSWHNKMQAVAYEDHLYTRTSHFSYEIVDNKLRLFPIPTSALSPDKFWFKFSIKTGAFEDDGNNEDGLNGVNNMNNLPFENIPYTSINSIGKQWIRRFALALTKETLGQVRGKFGGSIPIPGDNISLNADALLSQAKEEQNTLRDELKTVLDEMTYDKIIQKESEKAENAKKVQEQAPLPVFVG
tara:strand:+ start:80621 stop:81892 length:1272 start_codon:yes stop_codon:yes gene_type:complete